MKARRLALLVCVCGLGFCRIQAQVTPFPNEPKLQLGIIVGTVVDVNNDPIPGASVVLQEPSPEISRTVAANENGFFEFKNLEPQKPYQISIRAEGFADWTSSEVTLSPGQYLILSVPKFRIATAVTTVTVGLSTEEIATEQVRLEEQQRIFGFIPNFYVSYDQDAAPLTTRLKFQLAAKVIFDPITFVGVGIDAAAEQAGDRLNYPQGAKGYAERYGAIYTDGFTDIMIGGAILPSLLHQDPRYFYQGTGTTKSRVLHALSSPFVCKGDNGKWQPNYSTMGGDLASAAISNAYYPPSNRGVGLVFGNFLIGTGQRAAADLAQEFLLRRLTPKAKNRN
jgi:hypothetical protein